MTCTTPLDIIVSQSAEITRLCGELATARADAARAMREACIEACRQQEQDFLDPQYATPQPMGSFTERFACRECIKAIEALPLPDGSP